MAAPDERKVKSLRRLPRSARAAARPVAGDRGAPRGRADGRSAAAARRAARASSLRWLAAAAMVASIGVGVWIGRGVLPSGPGAGDRHAAAAATPPCPPAALPARSMRPTSPIRATSATAQRCCRSLEARLDAMPPAARDKVPASLATIQHAKQDLEQALGKDPGNALLQELLVNTYQDEMRVLTDVHEASDPGRGI